MGCFLEVSISQVRTHPLVFSGLFPNGLLFQSFPEVYCAQYAAKWDLVGNLCQTVFTRMIKCV